MNFRLIFRNWMTHGGSEIGVPELRELPFYKKYYIMGFFCSNGGVRLGDSLIADLRPQTDFDRHESALWLNDLLHDFYTNKVR